MKIQPLGDRVIVKPFEEQETRKGNIIIPENLKEVPMFGEVVAVGPGRTAKNGTLIPIDINIGDKVIYSKYSGKLVKMDDVDYLILNQSEIHGVY